MNIILDMRLFVPVRVRSLLTQRCGHCVYLIAVLDTATRPAAAAAAAARDQRASERASAVLQPVIIILSLPRATPRPPPPLSPCRLTLVRVGTVKVQRCCRPPSHRPHTRTARRRRSLGAHLTLHRCVRAYTYD